MSAYDKLRAGIVLWVIVMYLLIGAAAVITVAQASPAVTEQSERDTHVGVSIETVDDGALELVVVEGEGSATVRVSSPGGDYAGAGTYEVRDRERIRLPAPDEPTTVRAHVVSDRVDGMAAIRYIRACDGDVAAAAAHYSYTVKTERGVYHDERTVSFEAHTECSSEDPSERPTGDRDDPRERRDRDRTRGSPGVDDVHDAYNRTHDEATGVYERGHDEAVDVYERGHDEAVETYERGHSWLWQLYDRLQNGDPEEDFRSFVEHVVDDAVNDTERVHDDVDNDTERVHDDVDNDTERVHDDVDNDTERIREDLLGGDDDGNESGPEVPTPPGPPETPGAPTPPEPPETPTPPDGGDGGGESVHAEGEVDYRRDGTGARVQVSGSVAAAGGGWRVGAERSVTVQTRGNHRGLASRVAAGETSLLRQRLAAALDGGFSD